MDSKNKKMPNKDDQELQERLQKDFIVRNMPALTSLSGASYGDKEEKGVNHRQAGDNGGKPKDNKHQSTGIIIISAGLIVAAGLFYAAYHFLILPAMRPSVAVNTAPVAEVTESSVAEEEEKAQTATIVPETMVAPVVEELVNSVEPDSQDSNIVSLPIVVDSDNDGLSDVSEVFLGTNPQLADSDSDSYPDKQEIIAGYNPLGGGKLSDNGFSIYVDPNGFFVDVYPQNWTVNIVNQNSVLFAAPDQSFIQIAREESDQPYDNILAWYSSQFSDASTLDVSRFLEGNMGIGIISADQQIVYFLDRDRSHIFVVSYIKSTESMPYLEIFKTMAAVLMFP
ncbi:MAG TPA: thrombospondin type 3 repeat-containing protein [bacterium]|nr:MAG: hypothetical protein BWX82_00178 [Parcubacteria group bacterium ADurb.Bin115]HNU81310.1 thrombospondin type 3 repeat-containing protein [bacterium]HOD86763.1 thrombospondin type 3 repeat-containing protein [bacterium]HPW05464.1 thrombospondin type 3 repeat-containing protein [bacterium]HQB76190.1 thrombospondin type 3 repeat-containing protein [bacterium]